MKKIVQYFLALALMLCCLTTLATNAKAAQMPQKNSSGFSFSVGEKMPDFTVTDYTGRTITLSQVLKEKKGVMVNFWFSTCSPCAAEFPVLEQVYQLYKDDIEIIALNPVDYSDAVIAEYAANKGLSFPLALCPSEYWQTCGVRYFPTSIFIDRDGIIRKIEIGSVTDLQFFTGAFQDLISAELKITAQPKNVWVENGRKASTTVKAEGEGLTYQWYVKNAGDSGYSKSSVKTATYSCTMRNSSKDRYIQCEITDKYGNSVWSDVVQLRMKATILEHPVDCTIQSGKTAKFTVKAYGSGLKYQWQYRTSSSGSWKNATANGNTTATLSVPATASCHSYKYRCRVKDAAGNTIYTNDVNLSVLGFKSQPVSKTVVAGKTAAFTASATGNGLSYQWQYRTSASGSWKSASAAGNKTKTLSVPATVSRHGYQYRCKITDIYGNTLYSNTVRLYVLGIKTQPVSKTVKVGATAKFTVSAVGKGLTFQWQYRTSSSAKWTNVSKNGKKASYSLTAASRHNGYQYRCCITDSAGNVIYTKTVQLTVK